jgi:hypothetical protein
MLIRKLQTQTDCTDIAPLPYPGYLYYPENSVIFLHHMTKNLPFHYRKFACGTELDWIFFISCNFLFIP